MKRKCGSCDKNYNSEGHTLEMDLSLCWNCNIDVAIRKSDSKAEVMDLIQSKEELI